MKCYYAHSMHLYGKPQEARDIAFLESLGFEVVNPSSKGVVKALEEYKKNPASDNIMEFFFDLILECDCVAFRSHPDLKIPSGVMAEVDYATSRDRLVFEIPTLTTQRRLSLPETRYYLELLGER